MMGSNNIQENRDILRGSHESFSAPPDSQSQNRLPPTRPSMSYAWATNDSTFSRDLERWLGGDNGSPVHNEVQSNRFGTSQRESLPPTQSMQSFGFWFIAAMILPLFNLGNCRNWRCTTSTILSTVELFLTQVSDYCSRMRSRLSSMAREQAPTDIFAALMDIVLVVYAIGFLILSLYQASMFQRF